MTHWIQTVSGRKFDLLCPRVADINIGDIAHALSLLCRFNGHVPRFYSVAQHSVIVSRLCEPRYALAGLLHDAPEAYIGDITRPLKDLLPDVRLIEANIYRCIAERFGLEPDIPDAVHQADSAVLHAEAKQLIGYDADNWCSRLPPAADIRIVEPWSPETAQREFLKRFDYLTQLTSEDEAVECGRLLQSLSHDHLDWSQKTFGKDSERGPIGALKHLELEAREAQQSPHDETEYAACLLLLLDASHRAGIKPTTLLTAAQKKLQVCKSRTWPPSKDGEACQHIQ